MLMLPIIFPFLFPFLQIIRIVILHLRWKLDAYRTRSTRVQNGIKEKLKTIVIDKPHTKMTQRMNAINALNSQLNISKMTIVAVRREHAALRG